MARTKTEAALSKSNVGRRAARATSSFAESAPGTLPFMGTTFLSLKQRCLDQPVVKAVHWSFTH
jgi:hypothetical protein